MVSEMESVSKNSTNSVNNTEAYNMASANPQPVHSPQSVGIEFVRQYYTVLNRAPHLLFRFYSDDSTFIHGCLDKPGESIQYVKGQKQINAKIMSLNFENCHTKIRQVDSMETIGNGVVIQVIGELSNNGQPLRRFLQTFVLTPQSPNKYYVRNDIFRYQDGFHDDSMGGVRIEKNEIENKVENSQVDSEESQVANSLAVEKEFAYKANGAANAEEINSVPEKVPPPPSQETEPIQKVILETKASDELKSNEHEQEVENNLDEIPKTGASPSANEPKTYAGILGRSFQGSNTTNLAKNNINTTGETLTNYPGENSVVTSAALNAAPVPKSFAANTSQQRNDNRYQKKAYNRRNDSRESGKNDSDSGDGEHFISNTKKYPDENQLFIGNLLPDFAEEDLYKIFAKYGKILDVRINRQTHKMGNSKANRNYGFITFANVEVVDQIIAQKPIFHENHRYNVEKKQGKGNYDRNRERNPNTRAVNLSNPIQQTGSLRHIQTNVGSGGGMSNLSTPRNRIGPSYNHSSNNGNNPNVNRGQNFANRNVFNQQQNR